MQIVINGLLLGANRYSVDGAKGGSLYLLQQSQDRADNHIGLEVKKLKMPFELFDQLKEKQLPGDYEILIDIERGGQDSDNETAVSVRNTGPLQAERLYQLFGVDPASPLKAPANSDPSALGQPITGSSLGLVLSATRYDMEGNKGGRLYVAQQTSGRNPNQIGFEVIKFRMNYEVFALLQDKPMPGEYLIDLDLRRGAQDKAQFRVTGIQGDNRLDKFRLHQLFQLGGTDPKTTESKPGPAAASPTPTSAPAKTGTQG
ncbi:hypothetical protein [Methyloterricola oryzae]|uniref:hypothetical protein n=1 Tax=Methyloterricola oryzae TaxID=1495050 RepID=UPI0005EAFEA2|nr:hypothetical protein [Methyloterricola oryzae]